MIKNSLITALIFALPFVSNTASAAEIKILCASGMREIVSELQPRLGLVAGQPVSISFDEAGELRKRIQEGEVADVAILPRVVLDRVAADGNVVAGTIIDVSQSSIGIGVRKDGPRPDISTPEKLKEVLLAAKAIVVGDPASGGVAAVHVADVFRRLGIMDQLTPKLKLTRDQRNATFVANGEADIAVQLSNEIRAVPGIEFIPFPTEFERTFIFSAALGTNAKETNAAGAILQFLGGPETAAVVAAKGMDRPAAAIKFTADLKGSNQVPPNQAAGTGAATATFDPTTKQLSWKGNYSGLSGPATAAHIHGPAAAGKNARLVFWISENIGQCSQGECRSKSDTKAAQIASPFQGSAVLTDPQVADLMAGMYYVNVHTDAYPAGELRGQLIKSP
jgi:molybdate transport system substrate-binding protein